MQHWSPLKSGIGEKYAPAHWSEMFTDESFKFAPRKPFAIAAFALSVAGQPVTET